MSQIDEARLREEAQVALDAERSKPFVISIMGQTGVGKSSLLNALFNANLDTSASRPTTHRVEPVTVSGEGGGELVFNDMPGIGEAAQADERYLADYRRYLLGSDVVLWAIHADNRSVTFDQQALDSILGVDPVERALLASKITFVLTKVDLLTPAPWWFGVDGANGLFAPAAELSEILAEKEGYYGEAFVMRYASEMTVSTYNDTGMKSAPGFAVDEFSVSYKGILTHEDVGRLSKQQPRHAAVFERLLRSYRVIPCSARFRYNLSVLMAAIVTKLGEPAVGRFQNFAGGRDLDQMSLPEAKSLRNIVFLDTRARKILFDVAQQRFEGE
jgi:GTP-binding protein EngB required for normal cell division